MTKKNLYICFIFTLLILVSYTSKSDNITHESIDNKTNNTNMSTSDRELEERNINLNAQIDELQKQIEALQVENTDLKKSVEIARKSNQENSLGDEIKVIKVRMDEQPISIDGSVGVVGQDQYYLKYEDKLFISTDFIKEYYHVDKDYGVVIKGFPMEKYIIKTSDLVYIDDLTKGLDAAFNEQSKSGNYNDIVKEVDDLKIVYGEVGLREYIITSPLYMTQRGITIGSTRKDVVQAYGQLGENQENKWYTFRNNAEYSEGNAFTFVFDNNDYVSEIHYGWKN